MMPPATNNPTVSLYALVGVFWRAGWLGALYGGAVGIVVGFILMAFSGSIGFSLFGALWGFLLGGTGGFIAGVFGPSFGGIRGYMIAGLLGSPGMPVFWWPPAFNTEVLVAAALIALTGILVGFTVGKEMDRADPRFFFLAELKSVIELSGLWRLPRWKRIGLSTLFLCFCSAVVLLAAVLHGMAG